MKLRSIVVDDSSMQRMAVAKLVNNHPNLTLVADYSNAIEAKNGIKNNEIDLIFLGTICRFNNSALHTTA